MERLVNRLLQLSLAVVVAVSLVAGLLAGLSFPATVQANQVLTQQISHQEGYSTSDNIEHISYRNGRTLFLPHLTNTISLSPSIGFGPATIGINPETGYVYVANAFIHYEPDWESHDISILSGTQVITIVTLADRPLDVMVNPATGYVYVALANYDLAILSATQVITTLPNVGGEVSVVNPTSNLVYIAKSLADTVSILSGTTIVATRTIPSNVRGIGTASDSGLVYVTAFTDVYGTINPPGTITVLSDTQVITIITDLTSGPQAIAVNPVNNYIYVANNLSDTVTILSDTQTIATVPLNQGDFYWDQLKLEINPGSGYVYLMGYHEDPYSGFVAVLSDTQLIETFYNETAPTRPTDMTINPENGYIYVTYRLWSLWAIGGYYTSTMLVLNGAEDIAWVDIEGDPSAVATNPENGYLYIANWEANSLGSSVIVLSDTEAIAVIRGRGPTIAAVNSNDSLVYVADPVHQSVIIIQDGQIVADVGTDNIYPQDLAVHPETGLGYMTGVFIPGSLWGSGVVLILKGSQIITQLNVLGNPSTIEMAPDNDYVYILNGSNSLLVLSSTQIITEIETKVGLSAIKSNPVNGYVYTDYDGGLSIISETQIITHIEISDYTAYPRFIEVNPLNSYVYAVSSERLDNWDRVSNIWIVSGTKIITQITIEGEPSAVSINPVNGYIYLASFIIEPGDDTNLLAVISGTQVITQMIAPAKINTIVTNPVSGYVYVADWHNTVSVLSGTDIITTLPTGDNPVDIAINSKAGLVYVVNYFGRNITVIADKPAFLHRLHLPLILR